MDPAIEPNLEDGSGFSGGSDGLRGSFSSNDACNASLGLFHAPGGFSKDRTIDAGFDRNSTAPNGPNVGQYQSSNFDPGWEAGGPRLNQGRNDPLGSHQNIGINPLPGSSVGISNTDREHLNN